MRGCAGRNRSGAPRRACATGLAGALLFFALGCEPPGKPEAEPENTRKIMDWAQLYGENCSGCHSERGESGPGRPLNNALYLSIIPKQTLHDVVYYGRPGTAMPAWAISQGGPLTDAQVNALVDGIEKNWAKPQSTSTRPVPAYAAAGPGDPVKGKKLFGRSCFMCHGPGAAVGAVADPTYLSLVSDQLLRTAILEGWPALGMPDYRTLNLGHALSDQDITDVVAYLSSLRPVSANQQNAHTVENGPGQNGQMSKGNEGSGNGPGSPQQRGTEGNRGASSQGGGIK